MKILGTNNKGEISYCLTGKANTLDNKINNMNNYAIESKFIYKGFDCYVIFNNGGWRCGYITIDGIKLNNKDIEEIIDKVYDKLDISFVENRNIFDNKEGYTIGFDHNHLMDALDLELNKKYFPESNEIQSYHTREYEESLGKKFWSIEEIEKECKILVDLFCDYKNN